MRSRIAGDPLRSTTEDGVLTLTLNRPDRRNAIDSELRDAPATALEAAATDAPTRGIVITGAGGAFCAGGDLARFEDLHDAPAYRHVSHRLTDVVESIERLEKPVVAAIDGVVTGAGMALAPACDWRVGAPTARILFREGRVGLVPTHGGLTRLVKLVGLARAQEVQLGGEDLDAWRRRRCFRPRIIVRASRPRGSAGYQTSRGRDGARAGARNHDRRDHMEAAMLIGGEWRQAAAGEEIEVVNPATEDVVASVPSGDVADVDLAVATATRAFPEWAATDTEHRAGILARAAALIEERAKDIAAVLTSEQGKPILEARGEVTHLAHGVRYYAEAATKVRGAHQELPSAFGPAYGQVIRRPMGVCAAITPYNFPLTLLGTKVAPALASGNTVVAKPAATTPLATLEVARVFAEAGVPDGVLNVVTGRGSVIGDALVGHPDVRRVAFTGSTEVGRRVVSIAGPQLKRVSVELGGSDPVIVCEDADVDAAVKAVIIGRYWNAGQACLGCKRVFVHESVYDDFVSQLVERVARYEPGDGTVKAEKPRLRMGPIHTRAGRDELVEQIEDGVAHGGEVLVGGGTGGHDKGFFLEPAVVAEPGGESRLVTEEVFGPVLPVFRYSDFDDAIRRANDTPYGLGSSIWTHDVRRIHRAARDIDAGMTWVNQIHYGYDELPFGGVKASGFGKEHGLEALDSYVEIKSVVVGGLG
jgi:succinate-semialdehyde dehydrogenase / glutarate-semialdehyde dehydrogenase